MSADSPWALPVSVDQEAPSVNLAPPTDGSGVVVALLAEEGPRSHGWAPRVAVSLAREWAGDGLKVFLADGDLDRPALHTVLGRDNGEGMADAVVYGASPGRIGRPVPEAGFLFASAGTVIPDAEEAWAHPRWGTLLQAFRESGSLLLLYLPANPEGGPAGLVDQADRVIRLADEAPAEDPRNGHLYIHPAEGTLTAQGAGTPPDRSAASEGGFTIPAPGPAVIEDDSEGGPTGEPAPDFGGFSLEDEEESEARDDAPGGGLSFEHELSEAEEVVIGDFSFADEPEADGDVESPSLGFELPDEPAEADADLLESDLVVGDDFPSGDDSLVPDDEIWTGTGELQITDEWAGDGPSALDRGEESLDAGTGAEDPAPAEAAPSEAADGPPVAPEPEGAPGALLGLEGSVPPAASPAPTVAAGGPASAEPRPAPVARPDPARRPPVRARPVERNLTPWLLIILLVVVGAVAIASWLGYVTIPGLTFAPVPGDLGLDGVGLPPSSPTG
jgi:hypothetical protein